MSGTSLDGVDAALVSFDPLSPPRIVGNAYLPYPAALQNALLALNTAGDNEIERSQIISCQLATLYAQSVAELLASSGCKAEDVAAIGCHGQTLRHRPEWGFTVQIGNAAQLAELAGIPVVADFRSRDIAAGGQGAPLVPAFHQAVFGDTAIHRVIVNIGGFSNLTDLPPGGPVRGFDCGPGNVLMNDWIARHQGHPYDENGAWAASGNLIPALLEALLAHPFLHCAPPKSTGRDHFHLDWLDRLLHASYPPTDVQATLLEFSARCIAGHIDQYCEAAAEIYLCGGGARNRALVKRLRALLPHRRVLLTDQLGIGGDWVEAAAFAWLARQTLAGLPGNLPTVTGAQGFRVLGAIFPA